MAIYSGTIEYNGSASHPAGQTRELSAGSNNPLIIQAFGLDVFPPSGATAQGKISLTDLESGHVVRVDPQGMTTQNDTDYLKSHASSIVDMRAASEYLWANNRSELEAVASRINPVSGAQYTNAVIESLAVAYLTGDISQAKELLADADGQDKTQAGKDLIRRLVNNIRQTFTEQYGGLDVEIGVSASIDPSQFKNNVRYLEYTTTYTVDSARVIGSKASITNVNNKKQQLAAFNAVKRGAQELVGFSKDDSYLRSVNIEGFAEDARESAKSYLNNLFRREVADQFKTNVEKYIDDADEAPWYNVATIYARLWNELKLSGAEIPRNGIEQDDLEMYSSGIFSAQDVLLKYQELFTNKFKTALIKKFTQYVDEEAYAERALEQASPDLQIKTAEQREEWRPIALTEVEKAVDNYVNNLNGLSSFDEASECYYLPISEHNRRIIDAIVTALLARRDELLQDAGANNPATRQAFETKLETALLNKKAEMLADISPQLASQLGDAELEAITNSVKLSGLVDATESKAIGTNAEEDVIADVVKNYSRRIKLFIRRVTNHIVPLLKDQLIGSVEYMLEHNQSGVASDGAFAKVVQFVNAEINQLGQIGFMNRYFNNLEAVTAFYDSHKDELIEEAPQVSFDDFIDMFNQEAFRIKSEVVAVCEDNFSRSGIFEPSFSSKTESNAREQTDGFLDDIQSNMVESFTEQRGKLESIFQEAVDNKTVVTDNDLVALASRTAESCIDREHYIQSSNQVISLVQVQAWATQQYEYSVLFQEQLNAQYQVPSNVNADNWINNYDNLPEALGQRMVSSSEVSSMLDATIDKFMEQVKESVDNGKMATDDELDEDFEYQLNSLANEGTPYQAQIKADVEPYRERVIELAKEKLQADDEPEEVVGDVLEDLMFSGTVDYGKTTTAIYDRFIAELQDSIYDDESGLLKYVNGDDIFWNWADDASVEDLFSLGQRLAEGYLIDEFLDRMDSSWVSNAESKREAQHYE